MKYIFLNLVALLFTISANAAEPYIYSGLVNEQAADAGTIVVDSQQYEINFNTIVHGGLIRQGELGPMLTVGQRIGFNLQISNEGLSRVSEIWILE